MPRPIGISRDFLDDAGRNVWGDIGLDGLTAAGLDWEYLPNNVEVLRPEDIDGRAGLIFAAPAVTSDTFHGVTAPPLVLARFGVGYDAVDLEACTDASVAVTITPDGAQRPVATAALGMLLGGMLNLGVKDRLVRENRWEERTSWMGQGLTGKTVGIIGFGSTGTDFARLLAPFDVNVLAYDPYCTPERAAEFNATLTDRTTLAAHSDAVVVMAVLTPETRHFVDDDFLAAMKSTAILVNVSRGPIVDERALADALVGGAIRGAALDVFEVEPLPSGSPLLHLDNVLLTPHSVAWTDEMAIGDGRSAVQAITDALAGHPPRFVVNKAVLESPRWHAHLSGGNE